MATENSTIAADLQQEAANQENQETLETNNYSGEGLSESGYDIPRPALNLQQAAAILGKSLRSLERSIIGRWGNKLPDGWSAKRISAGNGQEWRIIPPPGFRLRQVNSQSDGAAIYEEAENEDMNSYSGAADGPKVKRRLPWRPENQSLESPAIVIDRGEEVEHLLRELVQAQKQLADERRLRMEDLRLITQMQGSMRLLEMNANETQKLKEELTYAKSEFKVLKDEYIAVLNAPWWKRLFNKK
jgi:hypothetical protein